MSQLTNVTKLVWRMRVIRLDKFGEETPITQWQEFESETIAIQEGIAQVELWIDQTRLHHEAIFDKRVVPLYT